MGPFRLGLRTAAIGVLEGDPRQEFGEISSVAILPDGRVVVLDRRIPSLRLFAPDGTPLFVAGRVGSGPGEFRLPSQVRLLPSGELAVLDVGLARLSFFRLVRDSLRFRRSFQVAPTAREFCVLGDSVYVAGARAGDSSTVLRYTLSGTEAGGFGGLFPDAKDQVLAAALSAGLRLECLERTGTVLLASEWLPVIRAYDARSGRPRWESRVSEFEEVITEHKATMRGPAIVFKPSPRQSIHKVASILALADSVALVQLEHTARPAGGASVTRHDFRLIRTASGVEIAAYRDMPHVLARSAGTLALADTTDFPRLLIYRVLSDAPR